MKKTSFIAFTLLVLTGCKNDSKQAEKVGHESESREKDSQVVKATIAEVTTSENKEIPTLKECTEKVVEYGSEQECLFPKSTMERVYQQTIREKEVEKSELLMAELPKKSVDKEINQDGLDFINYKVSANKVEIEFQFAGGVTTLEFEQQGENVKRTIIHSAD